MKKNTLKNLMAILLCCCCFFSITATLHAQNLQWVKQMGGPNFDDGRVIGMDASGNIYVNGRFKGTVDFDPGAGVQNLTATGTAFNSYILKLDPVGDFVWVRQFSGSGNEPGKMSVDSAGNLYLSGQLSNTGVVDFDPGPGVFNLTGSGGTALNADIWIVKLNTGGNLEWAKQIGGPARDRIGAISVDHTGNVYVTGNFLGTVDFNPGTGINNLISANAGANRGDVFLLKLAPGGDYVWARQFGAAMPNEGSVNDIEVDAYGNIYTAGIFSGTIDFDPGAGVGALTADMFSMFVSKISPDGNFIWAKNTLRSGTGLGVTGFITLDQYNHVYVAGSFNDTVDVNPGPDTFNLITTLTGVGDNDVFVSKLDTAGTFIWAKSIGSIGSEEIRKPKIDQNGSVITMGRFRAATDFDPSLAGSFELVPSGPQGDVFMCKLDSAGSFGWAISLGNQSSSLGSNGLGFTTSRLDNSIYITGDFSNTTDFDPGADTFNLTANTGGGDAFILKLNNCSPLSSTISTSACDSFNLNGTSYTLSGTYTQDFVTQGGCDSTVTLQLTINHKPDAAVTPSEATLSANTGAATYQWINCSGNILVPGATQQSYTATVSGSYAVIVTKNGCSDTSACYNISVTGIEDVKADNHFSVYPNPVHANLTVSSKETLYNANFKLVDVTGRVMMKQTKLTGNHFEINLSKLSTGIYILELAAGEQISRIKVVKE